MSHPFRHAICNEIYGKAPLAEVCCAIRQIGYTGIEIAPFTLSDRPLDLTPAVRREYRDIIVSEGLTFVGLHWLMVSPKGLHVTTPDASLRAKSWNHILELIDLCADLGDHGIMVFGSPQQRSTQGISTAEATKHYSDGLAWVASHAETRGVTILVEALPKNQSDVINTLAEAAAVVHQIGSPAVCTMFDTHNAADELQPHVEVVERYFDLIRHVHVNEMDGRHPGTADYDFLALFRTLRQLGYQGWISLEAFDFTPGPEKIAADSLLFLDKEIAKLTV